MCFNGYALSKQPKRGIELEPGADLLSTGPSQRQPCIVWHEARSETSPRKGMTTYARVPIHEKAQAVPEAHPTMLAFA